MNKNCTDCGFPADLHAPEGHPFQSPVEEVDSASLEAAQARIIRDLRERLKLEQLKRQEREKQLDRISASYGGPPLSSFVDARVIDEVKKESRHLREQVAHLEGKLDVAERALRGLGLMFT